MCKGDYEKTVRFLHPNFRKHVVGEHGLPMILSSRTKLLRKSLRKIDKKPFKVLTDASPQRRGSQVMSQVLTFSNKSKSPKRRQSVKSIQLNQLTKKLDDSDSTISNQPNANSPITRKSQISVKNKPSASTFVKQPLQNPNFYQYAQEKRLITDDAYGYYEQIKKKKSITDDSAVLVNKMFFGSVLDSLSSRKQQATKNNRGILQDLFSSMGSVTKASIHSGPTLSFLKTTQQTEPDESISPRRSNKLQIDETISSNRQNIQSIEETKPPKKYKRLSILFDQPISPRKSIRFLKPHNQLFEKQDIETKINIVTERAKEKVRKQFEILTKTLSEADVLQHLKQIKDPEFDQKVQLVNSRGVKYFSMNIQTPSQNENRKDEKKNNQNKKYPFFK